MESRMATRHADVPCTTRSEGDVRPEKVINGKEIQIDDAGNSVNSDAVDHLVTT
jgi:hypothetical protein